MIIDLNDTEARALSQALDGYLPELASEASRTERQAEAHELWNTYRALHALRARLSAAPHRPAEERQESRR